MVVVCVSCTLFGCKNAETASLIIIKRSAFFRAGPTRVESAPTKGIVSARMRVAKRDRL